MRTFKCRECDKKFERPESDIARFCSRECQWGHLDENYNILSGRPDYICTNNNPKFID